MIQQDGELDWGDLAICQGMTTNYFFDYYENDSVFATIMDDICLSCPVRKMCLREGVENNEYGLWGGVYLNNGKTDDSRNNHKAQEVWDEIRAGI